MNEQKTIYTKDFGEIKKRWLVDEADDVENAICLLWEETDWMEDAAYLASTQYAAMQERIEKLERIASAMNVALKLFVKSPSENLLKILQEYKALKDDK